LQVLGFASKALQGMRNHLGNSVENPVFVMLLLACVGLLVRFPFFFPAVINWDESTFILMGQSALDGHLPYTVLWDLKPPLAFFLFSSVISIFGQSIIAVRLAGLLFVIATAFLAYLIGKSLFGARAGLIAAALAIVFISSAPAGQATMTEVLAATPLMAALALLVRRDPGFVVLFIVGVLLASAVMIRLNLVYVAIAVVLVLLIHLRGRGPSAVIGGLVSLCVGGLSVLLLLAAPYLFSGQGELFFRSVFLAALDYSDAGLSLFQSLADYYKEEFGWQNALLWVAFLLGLGVLLVRGERHGRYPRLGERKWLVVFLVSILWSILVSGAAHGHYLIQLIPVMAIFAGAGIDWALVSRARVPVLAVVVLGLILPLQPVFAQYRLVWERLSAGEPLRYGSAYEIAEWMRQENPRGEPVYLMTDHIAYWFTDSAPMTKATTHPSNISKAFILEAIGGVGATPKTEMLRVLSASPLFVVKKRYTPYLDDAPEAAQLLDQALLEDYDRVASVRGRQIYRRRTAD
jgi:4-amino-4-deoxy-L-arabinose transferase-like glycosyltransferase